MHSPNIVYVSLSYSEEQGRKASCPLFVNTQRKPKKERGKA
ncbi:hypothetical protein SeseC_02394 [Streptococcus equi subsp. zooepidemicus ATCC 35246]|nr:hypothetical protein SeseC_02394 [Streptococcus equi subsp. zooepidemicus ATCC 35246]